MGWVPQPRVGVAKDSIEDDRHHDQAGGRDKAGVGGAGAVGSCTQALGLATPTREAGPCTAYASTAKATLPKPLAPAILNAIANALRVRMPI